MKFKTATLAFVLSTLLAGQALAQARGTYYPTPRGQHGNLDPYRNPYGPGVFSEGGYSVNVPVNCTASREQVLTGGQLVWRPMAMCQYNGRR